VCNDTNITSAPTLRRITTSHFEVKGVFDLTTADSSGYIPRIGRCVVFYIAFVPYLRKAGRKDRQGEGLDCD
jgi:hypothetical protein